MSGVAALFPSGRGCPVIDTSVAHPARIWDYWRAARGSTQATGVAECFVRQDRDGSIRVHVVPADRSADGTAAVLDSVRGHLFEVAGGPFPLQVLVAERVPLTVGGKGRFVESDYAGP